ncbi:hypothetical protein P7K49_001927, partial [Saguinus oedipus]
MEQPKAGKAGESRTQSRHRVRLLLARPLSAPTLCCPAGCYTHSGPPVPFRRPHLFLSRISGEVLGLSQPNPRSPTPYAAR